MRKGKLPQIYFPFAVMFHPYNHYPLVLGKKFEGNPCRIEALESSPEEVLSASRGSIVKMSVSPLISMI